jgi:hypothetical protein
MKNFFILISLICILLSHAIPVHAGFGITPPYVRNSSLTRNSIYEQTILLVRSDPNTALRAEITIDAPEISEWITVAEGTEFILPAGEQKVPMTVKVQVPEDAEFKNYLGNIRVKTSAADNGQTGGAVNISLGAQIDLDLTVIDKVIEDFRVRKIGISDLNEGHKFGWLYFPGKIRFEMMLENTGNVDVAPSEVLFRIYDSSGQVLFEETTHTNKIKKIAPFQTDTVIAELPTKLPSGNYLARYVIKNGEEVKQEGEINMSILPFGTLELAGYGFMGLSLAHKLSVLLPAFAILASLSYLFLRLSGRRTKVVRATRKRSAQ